MLKKILGKFKEKQDISSAREVIDYFKTERTIEEIVMLTKFLAYSGAILPKGEKAVDIPSSGGPSSLSTILCPLYIHLNGLEVRKLAVPGRPAGGIDVLHQIPHYRTAFGVKEVENAVINRVPYIHFEAANEYAPLDATLFKFRKKLSEIDVPQLAIASLLSKKLAVGLSTVVLDVRSAYFGNFGKSFEDCIKNSIRFCEVAVQCGITARCIVSDATIPYQPYIGRQESLLAIYDLLYGNSNQWLQNHNNFCIRLCNELFQLHEHSLRIENHQEILLKCARKAFESNLLFQESTLEQFMDIISKKAREVTVNSEQAGWISYNLEAIRNSIVVAQNIAQNERSIPVYPDPVGVVLLAEPGTYIEKGCPVLLLRYRNGFDAELDTSNWLLIDDEMKPTYNTRRIEVV